MKTGELRKLAAFIHELTWENIPPQVQKGGRAAGVGSV